MQLILQVKQVVSGANALNHAATDFRGESSAMNKAAISPQWLMREMVGLQDDKVLIPGDW